MKLSIECLYNEKGSALVMVIIVMMVLALLGTIVASLVTVDSSGSLLALQSMQVFYAAEAGLELAIKDLGEGGDGNFSGVSIGYATVSVTNSGDTLLTATATMGDCHKTLRIKVQLKNLPDAFYYAAYSNSTTRKLKFKGPHDKSLKGKVLAKGPEIKLESGVVLTDVTVHATNSANVINNTGYPITIERFDPSSPPADFPSFSTSYYDALLANQNGYPEFGDDEIEEPINLTNYTDSTIFISDNELEIEANVTGPGRIVCTGKIEVKEAVVIGNDVQLIAGGELKVEEGCEILGTGSILYSPTKVRVMDSYTKIHGSILTPSGTIELDSDHDPSKRGEVYGIVYSGNKAKIRHIKVFGSIVANEFDGNEIHCTNLVFDESYLPTTVPPGFTGGGEIAVVSESWEEL